MTHPNQQLAEQLSAAASKLAVGDYPDICQLLELAAATVVEEKPPLTSSEIGAVIWYTIRHSGHVGWQTFAELLLRYDSNREELAQVVEAKRLAYAPSYTANYQVKRQEV